MKAQEKTNGEQCMMESSLTKASLKKVVKQALKSYDLKINLIRFYAEEENILYLLYSDSGKYIMKLSQFDDLSSQNFSVLLSWLSEINQDEPLALKPLKTLSNRCFVTVDLKSEARPFYCVIYPWVPGKILKSQLSLPKAQKWGALMAGIHNRSEAVRFSSKPQFRRWDRVFYWEEEILFKTEHQHLFPASRLNIYTQMIAEVNHGLKKLYDSHQEPIIIHGDLHLYNVKYYQGKLYALDFDDCMWGYPLQDIAIALMYTRHQPNFERLKDAFKQGYSEFRVWPNECPGQLELLFMGRLLWIANLALYSNHKDEDHEERLQRYEDEFQVHLKTFTN